VRFAKTAILTIAVAVVLSPTCDTTAVRQKFCVPHDIPPAAVNSDCYVNLLPGGQFVR
jgi:hypothetical protein